MFLRPQSLRPDSEVTPEAFERGKRALVQDAAWASIVGALYGGVILTGFALELGASPLLIGVLAAIPFLMQVAQLPTIVLIERKRERRKIAVTAVLIARIMILALALVPWVPDRGLQLTLLVGAQAAITLFGAIAGCAVNSWLHQLLANQPIGELYAHRLVYSTVLGALAALGAGQLVEHWPHGDRLQAYSLAFAMAGVAGFIGLRYLAVIPEPVMNRTGPPLPIKKTLIEPLRDHNFRRLIIFMGSWNFASNLAAPFLTVYLLQQMEFGLGIVTSLWAVSQVANALTLFSWGRISDRLSNKAILAVALPAYFGALIALTVSALPEPHGLTLPLLFLIHIAMGMASGGIGLATGNIGLKLAPQGCGTPYLAAMSLVASLAAGIASILGGLLAQWFAARELSLLLNWSSPTGAKAVMVLQFQHWEFVFGISFALGLYVMHALSQIREGEEHSERVVVQQFVMEAGRVFEQVSSVAIVSLTAVFPFGRLIERRRRPRPARQVQPQAVTSP